MMETSDVHIIEPLPPVPQKAVRPVRVVVLGSGWGAISFVKNLNSSLTATANGHKVSSNITSPYLITLVSPRNYFLYTPLLPSAAAGTVEARSIVEPIRNFMRDKV